MQGELSSWSGRPAMGPSPEIPNKKKRLSGAARRKLKKILMKERTSRFDAGINCLPIEHNTIYPGPSVPNDSLQDINERYNHIHSRTSPPRVSMNHSMRQYYKASFSQSYPKEAINRPIQENHINKPSTSYSKEAINRPIREHYASNPSTSYPKKVTHRPLREDYEPSPSTSYSKEARKRPLSEHISSYPSTCYLEEAIKRPGKEHPMPRPRTSYTKETINRPMRELYKPSSSTSYPNEIIDLCIEEHQTANPSKSYSQETFNGPIQKRCRTSSVTSCPNEIIDLCIEENVAYPNRSYSQEIYNGPIQEHFTSSPSTSFPKKGTKRPFQESYTRYTRAYSVDVYTSPNISDAEELFNTINPGTSAKKRKFPYDDDYVKLAVIPETYPKRKFNTEEVSLVKRLVTNCILKLPKEIEAPTFKKVWERDGMVVFSCSNELTSNWLQSLFPENTLGENENKITLRVIPFNESTKRTRVVVHVNNTDQTIEEIIDLFDKQNAELGAKDWIVDKNSLSRDESSTHFCALISNLGLKPLEDCGLRPFCGVSRASVKIIGKSSGGRSKQ